LPGLNQKPRSPCGKTGLLLLEVPEGLK
jgi:hypothetical protein